MPNLWDYISVLRQVVSPGGRNRLWTGEERPLQTELLSLEQLHAHARALAERHRVDLSGGPDRLLDRLAKNDAVITATYRRVAEAVGQKRRIVPAEDWLLDNYHMIDAQVRMVRKHLPRSYSKQLPLLVDGPMGGYPRVYEIALELIGHSDGVIDHENLTRFVRGYQQVTALSLGELWALPIVLGMALIENLRRVSARLAWARHHQELADHWADRIIETALQNPGRVVVEVAEMAKQEPELSTAFVPQLIRRLQSQATGVGQAVAWVEQQLAERGQTVDQVVQYASQVEAAEQIAFANSITSMRALSGMNWRRFVETMSVVEKVLCGDPAGVYARMDFESRDRCRHVVEGLARRTKATETQVAECTVKLAQAGSQPGIDVRAIGPSPIVERLTHVGYYLIDEGLVQLQGAMGLRTTLRSRMMRRWRRGSLAAYLFAAGVIQVCITLLVVQAFRAAGIEGWEGWLLATLTAIGCSSFALTVVNLFVTHFTPPRTLPKLDFADGIPDGHRTIVVVPSLITSSATIRYLVDELEVRFLANRDTNLLFALLTDFPDADYEFKEGEERLLVRMRESIERLNQRYAEGGQPVFHWLHRPRVWNEREGVWMALERKRGKLMQLNRLILYGETQPFSEIVGHPALLRTVHYVITLDTDTQLPRDAARKMVAAMAHPLNRPYVDPVTNRVMHGYAILQPRVANGLDGANSSHYGAMMSGEAGIDPYTREVSDVYQDLFAEGTYIGKGIYDVEAFERVTGGRFPENLLLSHDLIESCFARSALVSDVQLVEDYPSRYLADMSRRHRWVRGDWQQWYWLLPRAPDGQGRWRDNPIGALGWWKLFDNIRRSVTPAALLGAVAAGWVLTPGLGALWTLLLAGLYGLPGMLSAVMSLVTKTNDASIIGNFRHVISNLSRSLTHAAFEVALLPFEAYTSLDAALLSARQMVWTKRGLMVWRTSGDTEHSVRRDLAGHLRVMWINPAMAFGVAVAAARAGGTALTAAIPVIMLWLIGPGLAWWLSLPTRPRVGVLTDAHRRFLRRVTRLTWRYFEVFVGPETSHLPPDNFQEADGFGLDARTSPTNIGVALLSNLTAMDLGYITLGELIDRTGLTFDAMGKLARYRGHFYNWYDARTLETLPPHYISAVDSGNLAGHLLVMEAGLRGLIDGPIVSPRLFEGLEDTIAVAGELVRDQGSDSVETRGEPVLAGTWQKLGALADRVSDSPVSLTRTHAVLQEVIGEARAVRIAVEMEASQQDELLWWARAVERQATAGLQSLLGLVPYVAVLAEVDRPSLSPEVGAVIERLDRVPTLNQAARAVHTWAAMIKPVLGRPTDGPAMAEEAASWLRRLEQQIEASSDRAAERIRSLVALAERAEGFADMDFTALYDEQRHLLRIGMNVRDHVLDPSYYDLLASEARLASYVAIAVGQLPQEHWFNLGRSLTLAEGHMALLSWSGSMFEYLMPNLVMPNYGRTLLGESNTAAVRRQIQYGRQRGVPWGVSESSYAGMDAGGHYQYQAFGVPGLGLKRGLGDDMVVAPYASAIAAILAPRDAAENLARLAGEGMLGRYGFYEAIDYTRRRLTRGQSGVPVRVYMSHHGGMTFIGIAQALLDRPMHRRFLNHPLLSSARLLLQERAPRDIEPVYPHAVEARPLDHEALDAQSNVRTFNTPHTNWPRVHLLSNGRYHVMVSNGGGGYSRWRHLALTRWNEDRTIDGDGQFIYLRDRDNGSCWSVAHHPTGVESDRYEAVFSHGRAEFRRVDHQILAHTTISVSPEDDVEVRRVALTNQSSKPRQIEVTSYGEIVLDDPAADASHPAFGKLFVQTELVANRHAVIATRRPRQAGQNPPWLFHQMHVRGRTVGQTTFETDRSAFLGRGRNVGAPAAMMHDTLQGTAGSVLDPIFAIRRVVTLNPEERVIIDVITGVAESRPAMLDLLSKYCDYHFADRVFDIAPARSQRMLQHLGASEAAAQLYGRLAAAMLHGNPTFRAAASVLRTNRLGQAALWRYGISGDVPIALLTISNIQHIELVAQALQAHAYWRIMGLTVDLVIINDDFSGYRQALHDALTSLIVSGASASLLDKPGGVFLRRGEQITTEDRTLMQTVARLVLADTAGSLAEQTDRQGRRRPPVARFEPTRTRWRQPATVARERDLVFYNGYGGFTPDGREYITSLSQGQATPAPWCNVLANDRFGTIVSESGSAYTWFENAHEFRLTPWYNDPVTDRCGEAVYLRDEHTGQYWSPTPLPVPGRAPYTTRHGFGYTIFEHEEGGIRSEMTTFVASDAPAKFYVLKIRNNSNRPRRLSVTAMIEWVLGEHRRKGAMHVVTELDPKSGALFARNWYNSDFPGRVGFINVSEPLRTVTGDRSEFIGRNRSLANPIAMEHTHLSGRLGAGLDPCGAMMTTVDLPQGAEREVVFMLGAGSSEAEARAVLGKYGGRDGHRRAIEAVWTMWNRILGSIHVETPDKSVDFLVNGWLAYQNLACRIWGRSGYYQSGGGFGFRDQLQDCMALLHTAPWIYRGHLIYSCEHQFADGDVQHWWHPPSNRGVRTRIRDDYLWLPYAVARYVSATSDTGLLDETRPYLAARPLAIGEESCYDLPAVSEQDASVYDHCVRAIEFGLRFGPHGLPLIGTGDWNDGMDRVGPEGHGESVWLAFFLYDVLMKFAPLAEHRGDSAFARRCRDEAEKLRRNIEEHAWDGAWYRRAYFDDGTPLGASVNPECQIDAIPQAWAAITRGVDPERIKQAMGNVDRRLVRRNIGIIQLFDPPFDTSDLEPGYIKGYPPGVRENGGQYTHAATWVTMAFAALGDADRAWECFNIINPIRHGGDAESIVRYKVEPYVMAADVYGIAPHEGRGGWTWYTGSGGWVYRLLTETMLGLRLQVDTLYFEPCLPKDWDGFRMHYRYRETFYHIHVVARPGHANRVTSVTCDGQPCDDHRIRMVDDRRDHKIDIIVE